MLAATEMQKKAATVLCIDDEQTALQIRQSLLESAGYNVLAAKSGKQGINTFRSSAVQAVVLDYWMADMNGMQVAREIRKLNPSVPIIILSAYGELLDESLGVADLWIRKGLPSRPKPNVFFVSAPSSMSSRRGSITSVHVFSSKKRCLP